MLTIAAAARELGISKESARAMVQARQLPIVAWTMPSGRCVVRVPKARLVEWIEKHYVPPMGERR